jgi:predicted N-formylglutamate amidohydrolase
VQGFGNAGSVAAHLLDSNKAYVIAASDSRGCIYNHHGLDIPKLMMHKERTGIVVDFPGSEPITPGDWAAAKAQFRPFIESLFDEIAERLAAGATWYPPRHTVLRSPNSLPFSVSSCRGKYFSEITEIAFT